MYASQVVNSGLWVASIPSFRNCLPISNTRSSPPTTRVLRKISVAIRSDRSWPSALDLHSRPGARGKAIGESRW